MRAYPPAYPQGLADKEADRIQARHERVPNNRDQGPVGVALSGGGIRSATFCLGVFRALARQGLVSRIDFLSTVSGGGYFGSFLGGLFTPRFPWLAAQPEDTAGAAEKTLLNLRSEQVDWLRENGRYLSPNGAGDTLVAGAILLRNWLAVSLVMGSFLFSICAAAVAAGPYFTEWSRAVLGRLAGNGLTAFGTVTAFMEATAPVPYLALPLLLLALTVVPLGWAYWFTQRIRACAWFPPFLFPVGVIAVAPSLGWQASVPGRLLVFESAAALGWWLVAWLAPWLSARLTAVIDRLRRRASEDVARENPAPLPLDDRRVRNRLSRWLSFNLWTAAALLVLAGVDGLGRALAVNPAAVWSACASAGGALFAAFAVAERALPFLGAPQNQKRLTLKPQLLAGLAAFLVAGVVLVAAAALAHRLDSLGWGTFSLIAAVGIAVPCGWTVPFLNLSSHSSLYGARLTRAYLGASNERRQALGGSVTELLPGDAIGLDAYDPSAHGGPLHLINVTVNETVSGKSRIEQRDRKGLPMSIGPCGISVGVRHHALWRDGERGRSFTGVGAQGAAADFQIFPAQATCDELDLGAWVGISGAAFTTGLGARTSLPLSLLLGLANVRLGYWWDSGIEPGERPTTKQQRETVAARLGRWYSKLLPVHAYLSNELLARFHGPARRRWYLSDGGHNENTGAYELIRRRLPFIVLCDVGCDPDLQFEDLANLARRVRTDFGAELSVFTREQLNRLLPKALWEYFGPLDEFVPDAAKLPHALLAGVFYQDSERRHQAETLMVILKPTLSGDEPLDVFGYQKQHQRFPQESTIDQFFDEAQWESYRRLGEHVASRVFEDVSAAPSADPSAGTWRPLDFRLPNKAQLRKIGWRGADRRINPA